MTIDAHLPQKTRVEETDTGDHDPYECRRRQHPGDVSHIVNDLGSIFCCGYEVPR